ncbi:F-box/kelch-repeat protein At3g23880-like [Cicer arietinum]|uniref:F-box/kelch-repeat protein At3g23880-like n=1 Tax=Cicer arietinum TaxID=3827 RepID=A0A1S2Z961_CICAR|nr:F-box/kelch-repeat protein At3g23880-like [Cicer arietinum]XP_012568751.1 F-box/kelch-repeat protein At3g23880-like [Cicer arietinum]
MSQHSNRTDLLPDELIVEILTLLTVKSILRLKCVSKSWNALISNPKFVKFHLQRSTRNKQLLLTLIASSSYVHCGVVTFPIRSLLENISTTLCYEPMNYTNDCSRVIGSCNGLLCLLGFSNTIGPSSIWIQFWNPATGILSEKFKSINHPRHYRYERLRCTFGYDNLSHTYKVVAVTSMEVKVFSLSDNIWKHLESLPVFPIDYDFVLNACFANDGVYLNNAVNWLAFKNNTERIHYLNGVHVEKLVVISMDLGTETYRQLLLPKGFDKMTAVVAPIISVLMDCLCFSYHLMGTHLVIWKMTEFGNEQSWTQFIRIRFQDLQVEEEFGDSIYHRLFLIPLFLSENGDTLILASNIEEQAIIYHLRDNRVRRTKVTNDVMWLISKDYVESLVPISGT